METWYIKDIGDGMTASMPAEEIKRAFQRFFQAVGEPADMAVFTRLESEGRLHCEVMAYFSPAAKEVAEAFEARPCKKPERMGLDLLAGNVLSWSLLFPESTG